MSELDSPLAAMTDEPDYDDQGEADEFDVVSREVKPREDSGTLLDNLRTQIDDINLARYMSDEDLAHIGMMVVQEYRIDENSRADWLDKAEKAMRFATQDAQPKQYPFPGASAMIYPLITQATLEFAARTYPAIVQGRNVVRGIVWGNDKGTPVTIDGKRGGQPKMMTSPDGSQQPIWLVRPGEKRVRADKIAEHMSYQLLCEMPEWEPQTDQLLHQIPVIGGGARKTFRDHVENRNKSLFVSLLNLVWNYHAPSFEVAPRHTEKVILYPNQIVDLERACDDHGDEGMFLPLNYGPGGGEAETFNGQPLSQADMSDEDAPQLYIEQHRRLDLDGDGYAEPYIVTVHLRSCRVVRIVARYDEEGIKASKDGNTIYKIEPIEHYTLYPFLPSIDGGSYPMGFGQLLRPLNEGINTSLNQLFDAGHLANTGGGFISDQLGIPSGQTLFQVGKFTRVTTKGASIRDAVFPIPWPGPNTVLFQILGSLVTAAKEIAGIGNILAGDAAIANAPPTTVVALIEQGMKFYTAIAKRVFRAEKAELAKLYALNKKYITEDTEYRVGDEWRDITPEDYAQGGGVEPIADPTMTTDMQKLGRSQIVMSVASDPLINRRVALTRLLDSANIDRVEELFAAPDPQAQQAAQTAHQMAIAQAQAALGAERAKELKDQTQAFLNMALARKNANAGEEAFIESQLTYLRLHIEALNTQVKAAAVDHKFHDTGMRAAQAQAGLLADQHTQARDHAHQRVMAAMQSPAMPTGEPSGPFPVPTSAPAGPDVTGASSPDTGSPVVPPDVAGAGPSGPPSQSIPGGSE